MDRECCCGKPKVVCHLCKEPICSKIHGVCSSCNFPDCIEGCEIRDHVCFISGHYNYDELIICFKCWEGYDKT